VVAAAPAERSAAASGARTALIGAIRALLAQPQPVDPAAVRQVVKQILAQDRYAPLFRKPGPLDQALGWIGDRMAELIGWLLAILTGRSADLGALLSGVAIVVVLLAGAAVALYGYRTRSRGGGERARLAAVPLTPTDHFGEADRLAALGDLAGAVRELALGVAAALAGDRPLRETSLTVREIFRGSDDPKALRPLLAAFEESFYGHHELDSDRLRSAEAAARPFRRGSAA
jgi:hypothetical protein